MNLPAINDNNPDPGGDTQSLKQMGTIISANNLADQEPSLPLTQPFDVAAQKFITRSHGPAALTKVSHTLAELPRRTKEPGTKKGFVDVLESGSKTVVGDEHGLLTQLLLREPIKSLFNQNVLNIHKDPRKLNMALTVIQGLVLALANRAHHSQYAHQKSNSLLQSTHLLLQ